MITAAEIRNPAFRRTFVHNWGRKNWELLIADAALKRPAHLDSAWGVNTFPAVHTARALDDLERSLRGVIAPTSVEHTETERGMDARGGWYSMCSCGWKAKDLSAESDAFQLFEIHKAHHS